VYNVFKRPMFKRGGTAQGSGIMSTVEPKPVPRIMAQGGYFTDTPFGQLLSGAGNEIKKPAAAIYDLAGVPLNKVSEFFTGYNPGFSGSRFFNIKGVDQDRAPFIGIDTVAKEGFYKDRQGIASLDDTFLGADDTSEAATVLPGETAMDAVFKRAEEKAKERKTKEIKTDIDDKIPPKPEKTFDNIYQEEFDKLEKVVGKDDDTKGLLALAIGEALSTPGTIADKSKILNKYLFKIAGERKSDRREIAKLAYSATKQIEAAKIAAGKEGYSEKLANEIRQYQGIINNPKASQQAKDFARQQIGIIGNTMKVLNPSKEGLTSVDR
jgi:hypothetical protein